MLVKKQSNKQVDETQPILVKYKTIIKAMNSVFYNNKWSIKLQLVCHAEHTCPALIEHVYINYINMKCGIPNGTERHAHYWHILCYNSKHRWQRFHFIRHEQNHNQNATARPSQPKGCYTADLLGIIPWAGFSTMFLLKRDFFMSGCRHDILTEFPTA